MPCSSVRRKQISVLSANSSGFWLIVAAGPISIRMPMMRAMRSSVSAGKAVSASGPPAAISAPIRPISAPIAAPCSSRDAGSTTSS